MKKIIPLLAVIILLFGLVAPALARPENSRPAWRVLPAPAHKISPSLQKSLDALQSDETMTVIVQLRQKADLPKSQGVKRAEQLAKVVDALQGTAADTQAPVKTFLQLRSKQGGVKAFASFWIFNGFSVTADAVTIEEIAALPDVHSITSDAIDIVSLSPSDSLLSNPEPNVTLVGAPSLWNLGYTGQGVVLASLDSGVSMGHPELSGRWRGGTNSWFDPFGQHPNSPVDLSGHGTWTMGVMLGGDA
ncbi:MAG: protease inhibitor I9 family protein, partial [Chloroflexota bacterium]